MYSNFHDAIKNCKDQNNTVIIVFGNNDYYEVIKNWYRHLYKAGDLKALTISLDETLHEKLVKEEIPSFLVKVDGIGPEIWKIRCRLVYELLRNGINVVHSDADAVWLHNPFSYFGDWDDDIIFSQGTMQPNEIHKIRGFVLCCGFFAIKSNDRTQHLFSIIDQISRKEEKFSDQATINKALLAHANVYELKKPYLINIGRTNLLCSPEPIRFISFFDMKILRCALLPHNRFPRKVEGEKDRSNFIIPHPLSKQTNEDTISRLKDEGLYIA